MPHIHSDRGQHDFTASAYIVRLDASEPAIMLHVHKKLGRYLQFGGHIELNESPWQAVIRELKEESGYDMSQLKLLQPKLRLPRLSDAELHPYPVSVQTHRFADTDHFHTDIAFAFIANQQPAYTVHENESKEFVLFTADELRAVDAAKMRGNTRETCLFILETCLPKWQRVRPPVSA